MDFAVYIKFTKLRVMLFVEGGLDLGSASRLSVVLDGVIDQGHRSVGLDLIHCPFIDASGVQVIEVTAERLRRLSGALTVRSPSALTRQLLARPGLAQLTDVDFEALDAKRRRPSTQDTVDDSLARRFGEALETRHVIALAQGVIMERNGLSEQAAYAALRQYSAKTGRPLRERATDIAASTGRPFPVVAQRMTEVHDSASSDD